METNIYVDGFNLYYGIKDTPYKWLDVSKVCSLLLPGATVHRIRYFTARVKARRHDPQQRQRQQTFLRALGTIPGLSIHYGRFLSHQVRMPNANPPPNTLEVIKTEEKGSDVNLAAYLLVDGYEGDYEQAVVISNDSDLTEPIRLVISRLHRDVGILNPQRDHRKVAWALMKAATFYKPIRMGVLKNSQFPETLSDAEGVVHKPQSW